MMNIPAWVWLVTVVGLAAVMMVDFYLVSRNPRRPSMRECALWVAVYVGLAVLFGLGVTLAAGGKYGGEFFAGWVTEYSLSVDNLFVFIIIMGTFAVPKQFQQKVLSIGIVLALLMRGLFIAVGAQVITRFDWLFYLFGAFLVYTSWKLVRHQDDDDDEFKENAVLRVAKKYLPATDTYDGARITTKVAGRRLVTPMLIVMIAIGTTDLLFALDSIPAIFGLTKEPYLVFTANAFALMGLRQLYFLIGGLLDKLVYLSKGLAVVLAFIGVKLVFEAMHNDGVSWAPEIPILLSLGIILGTLVVTTVASLIKVRRTPRGTPESVSASSGER